MSEPISIPHHTSPFQAIRTALGRIGYADAMQTLQPDLIEWAIEASDLISRPRTLVSENAEFEVIDNKVTLCKEWGMIDCVSLNGAPLTYQYRKGCADRLTGTSRCRSSCSTVQRFTLDDCYIHFTPKLNDGNIVEVEGLRRPIGQDGYPQIMDVCSRAISLYVAAQVCLRFRDNRYGEFDKKWLFAARTSRVELNRLLQTDQEQIGRLYFMVPGGNWGWRQFGYPGGVGCATC